MPRVCREHERPLRQTQQVIFPHEAQDPLVVDNPAFDAERGVHAAIAIATVLDRSPLDGVPKLHISLLRLVVIVMTIESCPAELAPTRRRALPVNLRPPSA